MLCCRLALRLIAARRQQFSAARLAPSALDLGEAFIAALLFAVHPVRWMLGLLSMQGVLCWSCRAVQQFPTRNRYDRGRLLEERLKTSRVQRMQVHTEAVSGIVGHAELLCAALSIIGLLSYMAAADGRCGWGAVRVGEIVRLSADMVCNHCKQLGHAA